MGDIASDVGDIAIARETLKTPPSSSNTDRARRSRPTARVRERMGDIASGIGDKPAARLPRRLLIGLRAMGAGNCFGVPVRGTYGGWQLPMGAGNCRFGVSMGAAGAADRQCARSSISRPPPQARRRGGGGECY